MSSVVIFVSGGVVQSVVTDNKNVNIFLADADVDGPTVTDQQGRGWGVSRIGDYWPEIVQHWVDSIKTALEG